ncbi:hypothetical protein FS749_004835 [Ceratobasidium sp. UAMH 11750]|nr:hypothetical protein FS749_004835 [Ceratobasidium sp. UAMH 11750]
MSAPSASRQATRAQERSFETFKERLETLETRQKTHVDALTHRIHLAEVEIKGLQESNGRLTRSNKEFAGRIKELERYKASMEQELKVVHAKVSYEASRLDVAAADLQQIAPGLTIKSYDDGLMMMDAEFNQEAPEPVASGTTALDLAAQAQATTNLSLQARDAPELKEAVASVLFSLYRVNNFNNIADKHYPHVPEDHGDWPHTIKPDGGRENHVRFNFEESHDSTTNKPIIERWFAAVQNQGEIRVPGAKAYLDVIGDNHLMERVLKKFAYEKRTYRQDMKDCPIPTKNRTESGELIPPPPVNQPNPEPLTEEEIAIKSAEIATMSTSTRQSFQKAKRDLRARKRPLLKGEDEQYLEPEYDTVLTLGAQSEDDYEVESVNGHEPRRTGRLVAREWWFASKKLKDCKAAIDAVPDPNPPKRPTMPVTRGPERPGSPRPNKIVGNRMLRWQIDETILAANEKWIKNGRVLENDAVDVPEPTSKKRKASQASGSQNVAVPSSKGKEARVKLEKHGKKLKKELGETTYDAFWDLDPCEPTTDSDD